MVKNRGPLAPLCFGMKGHSMTISNVFALLCGISLFLFGMNLMGDGLKKVAGERMELILYKLTSSSLKGILLGTGVTAVIQSSSATSVMVVGFVNSGMMKVRQAIGIIMGSIIGTSITGWVICLSAVSGSGIFALLSTDTLTAIMAVAGIVLLMFTKKERNHHAADVLLGFTVLMFGISAMTEAVYPLRESKAFIRLLTGFTNPLFGVLIGLVFTAVIQSASAAVGILQTLAVTGAVSFRLGLPVVMGIAIGASAPVLLSALGANAKGKRTALVYLLVDALGAVIVGGLFYALNAFVHFDFMDRALSMMDVALLNSVFRILIVLPQAFFIPLLEKLVTRLVPEKNERSAELRDVERLEERFLSHPALAIEQSGIALRSMAALSADSIRKALSLYDSYSEEGFQRVCELESIIDTYEDKLGSYLSRITSNELGTEQTATVNMYMRSVGDFERLGDHAKNLAESARELADKKIVFSEDASAEMHNLFAAICEILDHTEKAFADDDIACAYPIAPLEEIIDNLCAEYKQRHIDRVQQGLCQYSHGYVFNDMLTDLERVGDHCFNLSIALRRRSGEMSDRHGSLPKQEIEKTHGFETLLEEYARRYMIG